MLTLFYAPGACSMAAHIVLEESGEKYEPRRVDFSKAEQRSEAYLKINPHGRVPALLLDDGEPLAENTAILPYLGKRFGMWPKDAGGGGARALPDRLLRRQRAPGARPHLAARALRHRHVAIIPNIQEQGRKTFQLHLKQIDERLAGREWLSDAYSTLDPYAFTFYAWGVRREIPMAELKNFTAHKDRMLARPAVRRVVEDEKVKV